MECSHFCQLGLCPSSHQLRLFLRWSPNWWPFLFLPFSAAVSYVIQTLHFSQKLQKDRTGELLPMIASMWNVATVHPVRTGFKDLLKLFRISLTTLLGAATAAAVRGRDISRESAAADDQQHIELLTPKWQHLNWCKSRVLDLKLALTYVRYGSRGSVPHWTCFPRYKWLLVGICDAGLLHPPCTLS